MAELIVFDCTSEKIIVDYRLFTEVLNYKGRQRDGYMRFLRDTLPRFILKQRETKSNFSFFIASHHVKKLESFEWQDEKLKQTVDHYLHKARFLRTFSSDLLLTKEQIERVDLTLKEEQAYYVKLMEIIEEGYDNKVFKQTLFTGPNHAKQCADGVIDAGLKRVGSYDVESTYIEYKIVEPQQGEKVYIDDVELTLDENMSTGGEAKLFYLKEDPERKLVAKIYSTTVAQDFPNCVKFQHLMRQREKKLDILFNDTRYNGILENEEQIVFPIRPIYDEHENLIGVLMQNIKDDDNKVYQLHSIIKNKQYPYKGFDRLDLIEIAIQITKIVRKLHNCNIIIGDINLRNFLVTGTSKETLKVFAIDLDGCQIPEFPSYYETVGYRDPLWNIEDKKPRTQENEIYALLILIFEIFHFVHPFQYHYTKNNGTIINDFQLNMQNRDFPYANGKKEKDKQDGVKNPPTSANYVFSHLFSKQKDLFIKTFGELNGEQNYRPTLNEVMTTIKGYRKYVESDLVGTNRLEFDTFAISPKNRVFFKCSHVDCDKEHTYVHINHILDNLDRHHTVQQLFCGKHVQWYNNIRAFERKEDPNSESVKEFRKCWQEKIVKQNLEQIAIQFFEKHPQHQAAARWQKIQQKLAQSKTIATKKGASKRVTPSAPNKTPLAQAVSKEKPKQVQRPQPVEPPEKVKLWTSIVNGLRRNK